ncbi:MAG: SRPBCC family protein [Alphaproteobacteria bacterium]|nr:SRPBCC family protein [Alphaproteobacteria bacterium]
MSKVSTSTKLPVSADMVWNTIGSFSSISGWHPGVEKSVETKEAGKTERTLSLAGGVGTVVERLETHDDAARSYSYSIVSGPVPVADYMAEIKVIPDGPMACTVEWTSDFEAKGIPEPDAVAAIRQLYEAGFENLRKMFGG